MGAKTLQLSMYDNLTNPGALELMPNIHVKLGDPSPCNFKDSFYNALDM